MRVVVLAGGSGGVKLAEGFAAMDDVDLTVIPNVADDDDFHGLRVCPDVDSTLYALSGRLDRSRGWGPADDATRALGVMGALGAETWMTLGDADLGLHLWRTQRLRAGLRPAEVTVEIARRFGIRARVVLPTDDAVRTRVRTDDGWIPFQEYFVRLRCVPKMRGLAYDGLAEARPTPEALEAVAAADLVVIGPSNPLVSIAPILGVPGLGAAVAARPVLAVSPLVAGRAIKGPAARMLEALGQRADAAGVAAMYAAVADMMVIDEADAGLSPRIEELGLRVRVADTLMPNAPAKERLAREIAALRVPEAAAS